MIEVVVLREVGAHTVVIQPAAGVDLEVAHHKCITDDATPEAVQHAAKAVHVVALQTAVVDPAVGVQHAAEHDESFRGKA